MTARSRRAIVPRSGRSSTSRTRYRSSSASRRWLRASTLGSRRSTALLWAAAVDTDAADLVARAEAQRRAGSRGPAEHLAGLGALRPVLTADRAAAEIYVLSGPEIFDQLTVTCGWSPQDPPDGPAPP